MKNLTVPPPMALACIQSIAICILRLPWISSEIVECLASRAVTTLAKGLETFSLQVLSDFEEAFSEWEIFDYATDCALPGYHC